MKKRSLIKNIARRLAGSTAVVLLAFGSLSASAQIASSRHNLSPGGGATSTATFTPTAGNGELCVFCHTPHGADTNAVVPLWNRFINSTAAYVTYSSLGTSSLDGASTSVGSVSAACLSCHDGVAAMNVMINQPGSGGYTATGAAWSGTWSGGGSDWRPARLTYEHHPNRSGFEKRPSDRQSVRRWAVFYSAGCWHRLHPCHVQGCRFQNCEIGDH